MHTEISAGVGSHPCFLTFYNYDPYRWQNYKFFLILVCFFKDYHNYLLVHAQLLFSGKPISQYALYSLIFTAL